ncbi:hypothetical protein GCM10023075_35790 [Streptosporangium album]|uniref:isocitrate lyase/phosphoenolpyruvate mutase family protein n=1 Tax=Streptosporangium album TaxID=47479 RepID=UPI002483A72B|nr:isocitrate lyase/phosphoenolpyruvate mutase family protein [Streptosporangium album]
MDFSPVLPGPRLADTAEQTALIGMIKNRVPGLFANARTDPFWLGEPDAPATAVRRIKTYADAGADGVFAPGAAAQRDLQVAVRGSLAAPRGKIAIPPPPPAGRAAAAPRPAPARRRRGHQSRQPRRIRCRRQVALWSSPEPSVGDGRAVCAEPVLPASPTLGRHVINPEK